MDFSQNSGQSDVSAKATYWKFEIGPLWYVPNGSLVLVQSQIPFACNSRRRITKLIPALSCFAPNGGPCKARRNRFNAENIRDCVPINALKSKISGNVNADLSASALNDQWVQGWRPTGLRAQGSDAELADTPRIRLSHQEIGWGRRLGQALFGAPNRKVAGLTSRWGDTKTGLQRHNAVQEMACLAQYPKAQPSLRGSDPPTSNRPFHQDRLRAAKRASGASACHGPCRAKARRT